MDTQILGLDEIEIENTSLDDIDNEYVNLFFIGIDQSSSMTPYDADMEAALAETKAALIDSKEADEILIARANFSTNYDISGYKKICDFDTNYTTSGMTVLFDVICEGQQKMMDYIDFLRKNGTRVKAVFGIFTDGEDMGSHKGFHDAKTSIDMLNKDESITTAFISFKNGDGIAKQLGFKNILSVGGTASELRKAFDCLSKSVIENSKSVVNLTDTFFVI